MTDDKRLTSLNPQWLRAREIMGTNFFGVEEAVQHFGVRPVNEQLKKLAHVHFSEVTLEACKDSHILVAVFPLSILDIRTKVPRDSKLFYFYEDAWYNKKAFAKEKGELDWRLVRKTSMPDSTSRTWEQQRVLLSADEETPTARVIVYTTIGHFFATSLPAGQVGERLFEGVYVRTSSLVSSGYRVGVGGFGSSSLGVYGFGGGRHGRLGLASEKKPITLSELG